MATKDFDTGEGKDLDKLPQGDLKTHDNAEQSSGKEKEDVSIKNAHATGDGSYGRNDGSVPEEEPKEKKGDNVY